MNSPNSTRHAAENAARSGHEIGEFLTVGGSERVDRHQRDGLQQDAVRPLGPHLAKHCPAPLRLVQFRRIEMRADCRDPVDISAAQSEFHTPFDVLGGPAMASVFGG